MTQQFAGFYQLGPFRVLRKLQRMIYNTYLPMDIRNYYFFLQRQKCKCYTKLRLNLLTRQIVILLSAYGVSPSLPTSTTHPYLVKSSHLGLVRHEKQFKILLSRRDFRKYFLLLVTLPGLSSHPQNEYLGAIHSKCPPFSTIQ